MQKHMEKHGELIAEKFKAVDEVMKSELAGYGVTGLAEWKIPGGGYFIHVKLLPGMAKRVYGLCRDCGVDMVKDHFMKLVTPGMVLSPDGSSADYRRFHQSLPDSG